jgi:hypothetical protein
MRAMPAVVLYAVTVLFDGTAPVLHVLSDTP